MNGLAADEAWLGVYCICIRGAAEGTVQYGDITRTLSYSQSSVIAAAAGATVVSFCSLAQPRAAPLRVPPRRGAEAAPQSIFLARHFQQRFADLLTEGGYEAAYVADTREGRGMIGIV
jgi:hypothetical protein